MPRSVCWANLAAVHADDAVAGLDACFIRRAALDHVHNVDAVCRNTQLVGRLCIRDRQVGDAQIGPAGNIAVFQQLLRHLDGIIDRDGKAQALGLAVGGFGVDDADQLACHIEQAAAGVAGADAGAHLHQGHGVHRTGILDGNAAVQCADDAVGDRTAQLAQGVAHSHHLLAHRQCAGVAHGSRGQALGLDLHHSDITGAVCAHQSGGVILIDRWSP